MVRPMPRGTTSCTRRRPVSPWVTEASPVPVWFEDFYRAQMLAHTIRTWHPIIIPGPLQIPDYARALAEATGTSDDLVEERVAARIDLQQQTIERRPVPVTLIAVMDEAVLHRRVGSSGTSGANSSCTLPSRASGGTSAFRSYRRAEPPTRATSARSPSRAWTTPT